MLSPGCAASFHPLQFRHRPRLVDLRSGLRCVNQDVAEREYRKPRQCVDNAQAHSSGDAATRVASRFLPHLRGNSVGALVERPQLVGDASSGILAAASISGAFSYPGLPGRPPEVPRFTNHCIPSLGTCGRMDRLELLAEPVRVAGSCYR